MTRVNPEYLLAELLYSGLTRLNDALKAESDLAESWEANADLTKWTFKLRQGLKFHDGSPCTARDVEASIDLMLNPKPASPARNNIGHIKSLQTRSQKRRVGKESVNPSGT